MKKPIGKLCVITDVRIQSRFSHLALCELAVRGGASVIQLRDKTATDRDLYGFAVAMQTICSFFGATLIINDRPDITLVSNADGVHLGQEDLPINVARALLGEEKLIGISTSSLEEAIQAEKNGADYIGYGHIFETNTKYKLSTPKGIDGLKEILATVSIPVMAIGGITSKNIHLVSETKTQSIAVVSAVCSANNPEDATKELIQLIG